MTDIPGNLGVGAPHNYINEKHLKTDKTSKEPVFEAKETDLNFNPDAISGRTLVKTSGIKHTKDEACNHAEGSKGIEKAKDGAYVFDAHNIQDDVETLDTLIYFTNQLKKEYMAQGLSSHEALEKAMMATDCLVGC